MEGSLNQFSLGRHGERCHTSAIVQCQLPRKTLALRIACSSVTHPGSFTGAGVDQDVNTGKPPHGCGLFDIAQVMMSRISRSVRSFSYMPRNCEKTASALSPWPSREMATLRA